MSQLEYLKDRCREAWEMALAFFYMPRPGESAVDIMNGYKEANKRVLWDADDNDQHLTDELAVHVRIEGQDKLAMNISNAHKTDKKIMWDKIDELMRTGKLLLLKDGKAWKECESTILLRGPNGEIYSEVDDKAYHPDLLPAMRYALWNVLG
jgi:hypothetical protein